MATKMIGKDTYALKVDTAVDITALSTEWNLDQSIEIVDTTPLTATSFDRRAGIKDWGLSVGKFVDSAANALFGALLGAEVTITLTPYTGGKSYSGIGIVDRCAHASGSRTTGQNETCHVTAKGDLTFAAP